MAVAECEEESLPIPEICSSNPAIGKFYFTVNCILAALIRWNQSEKRSLWPNKKTDYTVSNTSPKIKFHIKIKEILRSIFLSKLCRIICILLAFEKRFRTLI